MIDLFDAINESCHRRNSMKGVSEFTIVIASELEIRSQGKQITFMLFSGYQVPEPTAAPLAPIGNGDHCE